MSEHEGRWVEKTRTIPLNLGAMTIVLLSMGLFTFLALSKETFLTFDTQYSMIFGISIQFFTIIGFTYLMIMGEVDMSVGSMYGFGGAFLGVLTVINKIPFYPALLITLFVSGLIGFLSGICVVRFRVSSLMITIGVMTAVKGINWVLINSLQARVFPPVFRNFIKFQIADIHWTVLALILIVIVLEILLYRTTGFKKMFFVGQNIATATIYGIKANKIKVLAFIASAMLSSFGGILATSRIAHADVTTGDGLEFIMVIAAVLGGASLFGGKGSILRSVLGLYFLAMVQNGMISFSIDPYVQKIILGSILIISVFIDARLNKNKV
jgi:ribose/xylose/arabinose/galactoside ABC-type transport system permease subunit